jgi:hypothetical protein
LVSRPPPPRWVGAPRNAMGVRRNLCEGGGASLQATAGTPALQGYCAGRRDKHKFKLNALCIRPKIGLTS